MGLGYEYDEEYLNLLMEVTPEDIKNTANKYFKRQPYKLVLMPK